MVHFYVSQMKFFNLANCREWKWKLFSFRLTKCRANDLSLTSAVSVQ